MAWWYAVDGKKHGPISDAEISRIVSSDRVGPSTLFWREGMDDWQKLDEIEELRRLRPSEPPPLPAVQPQDPLAYPLATPGPRFFARIFDVWWESAVVAVVGGYVLGQYSPAFVEWMDRPGSSMAYGMLCVPVAMVLDAILYASTGNTPGKAILGLKVGTITGARLSFVQYLLRNLKVWAAGLALGLPFIALITMGYQHNRLANLKQTSWDATGDFRVRAKQVGVFRKGAFAVAFLALFVGMAVLNAMNSETERESLARPSAKFQWKNPQTGRSATIDPRWSHEAQRNADGQEIYTFSERTGRASVVLGVESAPHFGLREYVAAFRAATTSQMRFDGPGSIGADSAWRGRGHLVSNPQLTLEVEVVQAGKEFWRVVTIRDKPYEYSTAMLAELHSALWGTVR